MKEFKGTPLKESDIAKKKVLTTEWHPKTDYGWDSGYAIGKFLQGLKEGKILGTKCVRCGRVMVPPRSFCEWCHRDVDEWVELKDTGRILTFSVSFVNWDASRREKPQIPIVVEIDGASPGMGIMHLLEEVGETLDEILKRVKVGKKVKAVFKPEKEREGAITDIMYFKLLEE